MATAVPKLCVAMLLCTAGSVFAQSGVPMQAVAPVQPGAPGQPTATITAATATVTARPPSEADVRFMQDMIMHHGQAVEMTELLKTRAANPEVVELGKKIDVSQTDEIRWMKQWLTERGIPIETMSDTMPGMAMDHAAMDHAAIDHSKMNHSAMADMDHSAMAGMDHSAMAGMDHSKMAGMNHAAAATTSDPKDVAMMPGMLTPRQMDTLRASTGVQFDKLFLTGMMQHHNGALLMVKQLFQQPGAGQDPQLFDFANDVDNTQLAEIDIMKGILRKVYP